MRKMLVAAVVVALILLQGCVGIDVAGKIGNKKIHLMSVDIGEQE